MKLVQSAKIDESMFKVRNAHDQATSYVYPAHATAVHSKYVFCTDCWSQLMLECTNACVGKEHYVILVICRYVKNT